MSERLRIFNEQFEPAGVKERQQVHKDGDWHETFHCWFYQRTEEGVSLYFQKRAEDKAEFPSLFDITVAGHVEAGEEVIEGGLREIEEEVGTVVSREQLYSIGTYKEVLATNGSVDRELCRLFLLPVTPSIQLEVSEEVTDIVKVNAEDLYMIHQEDIAFHSVITGESGWMGVADIVPHEKGYFEHIFHYLKKVEKL